MLMDIKKIIDDINNLNDSELTDFIATLFKNRLNALNTVNDTKDKMLKKDRLLAKLDKIDNSVKLLDFIREHFESRWKMLNGSGVMDVEGIEYTMFEEKNFLKIKEMLKKHLNTFVIYYAYGLYECSYVFSRKPEVIYENLNMFEGHGTCIVLDKLPKVAFFYGGND